MVVDAVRDKVVRLVVGRSSGDVLGMPNIDAHDGWLIFKLPPAELGIHPAGDASPGGHHELYFMCDDLEATVAGLTAKGVEFTAGIAAAASA